MIDKNLCDQFLEEQWEDMTWSYSRISSFVSCPYSWYETYILGHRSGNFYAYTGSAYHKIMEDFYNFWLKGGRLDMETIIATLDIKLNRRFEVNPYTDRYAQSTYDKLLDSLNYFQIFEDVTAVERLIEWDIAGYMFQGYIDLDAGEWHYDWKSSWDEEKYARQQNLYLYAKEQVDGIVTKGFKIPQYKNKLKIETVNRNQFYIDDAVEWVQLTIPQIKKALENAEFVKKTPSSFFCVRLCSAKNCEHRDYNGNT